VKIPHVADTDERDVASSRKGTAIMAALTVNLTVSGLRFLAPGDKGLVGPPGPHPQEPSSSRAQPKERH
jgi:hypothetical protein